jgi:hypothetical protein
MRDYSLSHLTDAVLLRDLTHLIRQDRSTTADVLVHIAEVDARRLYVPAGHASMHAYCVDELRLSEGAAYKRIRAARAAREFPELLQAVAEGRLHLAAVCLLAPYLTRENVGELIAATTHRRKSEIETHLARQFPLSGVPAGRTGSEVALRAIPRPRRRSDEPRLDEPPMDDSLAPGTVGSESTNDRVEPADPGDLFPEVPTNEPAGQNVESSDMSPRTVASETAGQRDESSKLSPGTVDKPERAVASPERYLLKVILDKEMHDALRYAQALLSHVVPSGDVAQVLRRALDALIPQLEKRKFGAITRKRPRRTVRPYPSTRTRHIPAHVRRAVWERDQGRCTFMGTTGHRCNAMTFLEFDHIKPHARGGRPTVEGTRLRCRAHNQYEAERVFGPDFMAKKRDKTQHTEDIAGVGATTLSDIEEAPTMPSNPIP